MVLEGRIPYCGIAEIALGRNPLRRLSASGLRIAKVRFNRDLHADRRLNIEVPPAFAESQGGLRNHDIVGNAGSITARNRHLEEAGDNVVSVLLVC